MVERRVWERLRNRALEGAKFRRQGRLGPYVVDFVCLEHRLVVEIDSALHNLPGRAERDAVRQQWLEREGYRVLRFTDREVYDDLDRVLSLIVQHLVRGD